MTSLRYSAIAAVVLAFCYPWWLKDLLLVKFGIRRLGEPIENFPYKCRNLKHGQLEGCGDMWLDERTRVLYAACAGIQGREEWNPSLSRFNASGRRPSRSELTAIYIDEPRKDGLFKMHRIQQTRYESGPGDGDLDLAGFDVEIVDLSTIRFWLINQRPPYDSDGKLLDASKVGANTTIEVYDYKNREKMMTYTATGKSSALHSPNKIAWMGGNSFVVSNDRSAKVGWRKKLDPLLGGGSLVYHDDWSNSYKTTPKRIPIPGNMVRGQDDRIYVPSLIDDKIRIFQLEQSGSFKQVHVIKMGMPIAGLSTDSMGIIWAVGRSKVDLVGGSSFSSVFKIEKIEEEWIKYKVDKVLEDKEAKFVRGATVVRHDAKTERIFIGGAFMPFITVCDLRK
ncbi:serum paraoxonase/arylesteras-like protein [Melanomma pulvis-pyrius CBS 109.77]|uniref:Serum paraoxonase/arylesteras-like protein n=1 Tax=Melanomma pulvis-pyrius CBS 109.77 TaxID=1314802 RepID=A0A6A6WTR2_9PLEO|nr:serum paraoxonase/arylesteras-like protein [Melanomma pulvis-pyrius CBS 109.77]